uniref:STING ER exit protein n=1 Tax=Aceria tosichella TaxID=561515 RepID=A0A6G1SGS6_9ACAR
MPKVVSRSIVCTDQRAGARDDNLTVYYCWCGNIGLILDCKIHKLPLRERDGARVLDSKRHNFKLSCVDMKKPLVEDDVTFVKWSDNEFEKQYRLKCKKCCLWTFYKHSPDSSTVFIVDRAMNIRPRNPLMAAKVASGALGSTEYSDHMRPATSSGIVRRTESNPGKRFGSVAVSTMEEEEAEVEAKDIANSYQLNATIVKRELERQEQLRKRQRMDD